MASTLQPFAKKRKKEETTVITARIPNSKYELFKKYCEDLGLSINEAINLLVDAELKEADIIIKNEADVNQISIDDVIEDSKDEEEKLNTKVNTKTNTIEKKERFVYEPYMNHENKVPCPICEKFISKTNYVKHSGKMHEMTAEEVLTSEMYQDKIKEMLNI
jgi:antitoxin component of RelBE/YafQ-DinJ toxin-antitoxin module